VEDLSAAAETAIGSVGMVGMLTPLRRKSSNPGGAAAAYRVRMVSLCMRALCRFWNKKSTSSRDEWVTLRVLCWWDAAIESAAFER